MKDMLLKLCLVQRLNYKTNGKDEKHVWCKPVIISHQKQSGRDVLCPTPLEPARVTLVATPARLPHAFL